VERELRFCERPRLAPDKAAVVVLLSSTMAAARREEDEAWEGGGGGGVGLGIFIFFSSPTLEVVLLREEASKLVREAEEREGWVWSRVRVVVGWTLVGAIRFKIV
jgi:hypothetical protein